MSTILHPFAAEVNTFRRIIRSLRRIQAGQENLNEINDLRAAGSVRGGNETHSHLALARTPSCAT